MKPADIAIAVLVAVTWGFGFIASRLALNEILAGAHDHAALCHRGAAVPVLAQARRLMAASDRDQLLAVSRPVPRAGFAGSPMACRSGSSSVIVQSQALFTIAFAAIIFRESPTPMQGAGIAVATAGLLMICGTVGYDFGVAAFAIIMISPVCFATGNLLLRKAKGAPMFDLFAWLCFTAAVPLVVLTLRHQRRGSSWQELTHASADGGRLHALPRRYHDQLCLLALGPALARPSGRAGGAVCAAGAVRRRRPPPASYSARSSGHSGSPA